MAVITLDEVKRRVRAVAAERPEYVYQMVNDQCLYFNPDGTPSCLVGHALADELRAAGVSPGNRWNGKGIYFLIGELDLPIDQAARHYLSGVQSAQDSFTPWGQAVE